MSWQAELPFPDRPSLTEDETPRTVALGDRIVPYVLRRSRRRSIGLTIDERGLRVGAPYRSTLAEVETLILKHGDWVARKLDEWRNRQRLTPKTIADGSEIAYLGANLVLRLTHGGNEIQWDDAAPLALTLALRSPMDAERLLERALCQKALSVFRQRLAFFAERFELPPPPLALTAARTRWGSCSLKSGIRLNWRLIHHRLELIDYVVVHELAHLREMNHSKRFWAIVGRHCPNFRHLRQELRRHAT